MRYSLIICTPKLLEFVSCQLCGKTGSPANSEVSQDELRNSCTWTWTTQNGVNGYTVTGANGNSIFLPAAGYRNGTNLRRSGSYGNYWSSSLNSVDSYNACYLYFCNGHFYSTNDRSYFGHSVRPVCERIGKVKTEK